MEISENLLTMYHAEIEQQGDSYIIEVPEREISVGAIDEDGIYRIAIATPKTKASEATDFKENTDPSQEQQQSGSLPPMSQGDDIDVEIEDVGDQGDGIARVGPGYVVIVPDTELGERVSVRITNVRENMAFAEVVEYYDRRE